MQHACVRITTIVVTVFLQTAVTLLAAFQEGVSADGADERLGLVVQAVVHALLVGEVQILERAGRPVTRAR